MLPKKYIKNSAIIWEGKSVFTAENLVGIATGFERTDNTKLGHNTVQVWILRQDKSPTDAFKIATGTDTCGDCPLRHKTCYVLLHQAPSAIWHRYQEGKYEWLSNKHLEKMLKRQKILRLTAYGDVGAVPTTEPFLPLIKAAKKTIGYTHQWREDDRWKGKLMASVESIEDALLAQSLGWQTFRVKLPGDDYILPTEKYCTNYLDALVQCQMCQICDGAKQSIVIDVHGLSWKVKNFENLAVR
jgi:hypothetical protein